MILSVLAIFGASCSSERGQPNELTEEARPANPVLPEATPVVADSIASTSVDTMYSDAPMCNALVKRIADEMVPCLQRIKPERGDRLQLVINTFRSSPRLRLDPIHRDELLARIETDCQSYWLSIVNQLDSKAPEGQCRLDAAN